MSVACALIVAGLPSRGLAQVSVMLARDPSSFGVVEATFSELVRGLSTDNFVLVAQSGDGIPSDIDCYRSGTDGPVDCASAFDLAFLVPFEPLIVGFRYTATINEDPGVAPVVDDDSGDPVAPSELSWRLKRIQEWDPAIEYKWQNQVDARALDGGYKREILRGARAYFCYTGYSVTWVSVFGPRQGMARVVIDDLERGTLDNYASFNKYRTSADRRFITGEGDHCGYIEVLGQRNSNSNGYSIAVDGLYVGSERVRDVWYDWAPRSTFTRAVLPGEVAFFRFWGTGFRWFTVLGPRQGKAILWTSGIEERTIDNYSPTTVLSYARVVKGLRLGTHLVSVKVLGDKDPSSSGYNVSIDGFEAIAP